MKKLLLILLLLPILLFGQEDGNYSLNKTMPKVYPSESLKFVGKRCTWSNEYPMIDSISILKKLYSCPYIEYRNNIGNRYNFIFYSVNKANDDFDLSVSKKYILYFYVEFFDNKYRVNLYDFGFAWLKSTGYSAVPYEETLSNYVTGFGKNRTQTLSSALDKFFDFDKNDIFE